MSSPAHEPVTSEPADGSTGDEAPMHTGTSSAPSPPEAPRIGPNGQRLCGARRTNGEPCNAPAMTGQRVCRMHGGSSPQAKRKAALRLVELIDPAIATLAREMVQADTSSDRQRAANSILDRAGVPRVTKEISEDTSREVLLTRLREIRQQKRDGTLSVERTAEQISYRRGTSAADDQNPNSALEASNED